MRCLLLIRSVFAGILLLMSGPLFAFDDWQHITQDALKMTAAQAGNAEAIILYHESISDDGKKDRREYWRYKILSEKGKRLADVEIPYYSTKHYGNHITDLKARVISPD